MATYKYKILDEDQPEDKAYQFYGEKWDEEFWHLLSYVRLGTKIRPLKKNKIIKII